MDEIPVEDVGRALQSLAKANEAARGPVAESIARRRATRLARLAAAAARLEEELGSDADDVVELKSRIGRVDTTRVALERRAERERRRPLLKPHEWMVYGRVVNHDKSPAEGVRVRVFDKDRKFDDLLGESKVDEFGDFVVGPYHERDFLESGEGAPELYIKVYGAQNRILFDGSKQPRFEAGRIEYFEIVLPAPKNARASTAKTSRKR